MKFKEEEELKQYYPNFKESAVAKARLNGDICLSFYYNRIMELCRSRNCTDAKKSDPVKVLSGYNSLNNAANILAEVISEEYGLQTKLISDLKDHMLDSAKYIGNKITGSDTYTDENRLLDALTDESSKGVFFVYPDTGLPEKISDLLELSDNGKSLYDFVYTNRKFFEKGLLSIRFKNIIIKLIKNKALPEGIIDSSFDTYQEKKILVNTVLLSLIVSVGSVHEYLKKYYFRITLNGDSFGMLANIPVLNEPKNKDLVIFGQVNDFEKIYPEKRPKFTNGYGLGIYSIKNKFEIFYSPHTNDLCLLNSIMMCKQWIMKRVSKFDQCILMVNVPDETARTIQIEFSNEALYLKSIDDIEVLRLYGCESIRTIKDRMISIGYAKSTTDYFKLDPKYDPTLDELIIDYLIKDIESKKNHKSIDMKPNSSR